MAQVATISSGTTQSNIISIKDGTRIVGLYMPAGWDAAALTILGSIDGTTFFPVFDSAGTEISFNVASSRFINFGTTFPNSLRFFRLRSGVIALPVTQTVTRLLTLLEETLNVG
jgi:hypothetical protein